MRLSFVRLTRFLARLMARPRVTLLTSDTLSMVSSNVNRSTRLWVAFDKNYARKPRQPYFVWCLRVFFLMAFHTLSLLHFPLPHFQRPLQYLRIRLSWQIFYLSLFTVDFFFMYELYYRTVFSCTFLGQLLVASLSLLFYSLRFAVCVALSCCLNRWIDWLIDWLIKHD